MNYLEVAKSQYAQYIIERGKNGFSQPRVEMEFPNNYGVSLIIWDEAYGVMEAAVLRNGKITYQTSITEDVVRLKTREEVYAFLESVKGLSPNDDEDFIIGPCGCYACNEEWQRGHAYCDVPTPELLAAEERGQIRRQLDNSSWHWYHAR